MTSSETEGEVPLEISFYDLGSQSGNGGTPIQATTDNTKVIFDTIGLDSKLLNNSKRYRKTNRDKDYRSYYKNDKAIEAVAKHFDSDIKTFGDFF